MGKPRVIVVGAGPAGIRAVETLVRAGIRPMLIEESRRDGGQIYRRQPEEFTRSYTKLYGTEAGKAQALHHSFSTYKDDSEWMPETLAWNIENRELHVVRRGQAEAFSFDALIICSGATDRLLPVRGWDLAGCYSLGAAQVALKAQACSIGRRVVFMGSGPLLYLVASQYVAAGARVAAVLDTSPFVLRVKALSRLAARPDVVWKGLRIDVALRRARIPILNGVMPDRIVGTPQGGVSSVGVIDSSGNERNFDCDSVALGYHLRPESQLADLAKADFHFDHPSRQWVPKIDRDGRASVPGIYLAGDGVRLAGADAAEDSGRLAAMACLSDLGHAVDASEAALLRKRLSKMERFRLGLLQAFPWPHQAATRLSNSTVVCRCEAVTVGDLREAVENMGAGEINRAKALCRVGMGRCQGRYCGSAAAEIISHAAGIPVEEVGRIRSQGPVKPLAISTEAATR
jgi:NADPH-dependent 2,4-dienoyl-CoA reductase/sulfur reductase-like enzyme